MSARLFVFLFLSDSCILLVCFRSPFKHPLSNIFLWVYLSKKKKKSTMQMTRASLLIISFLSCIRMATYDSLIGYIYGVGYL